MRLATAPHWEQPVYNYSASTQLFPEMPCSNRTQAANDLGICAEDPDIFQDSLGTYHALFHGFYRNVVCPSDGNSCGYFPSQWVGRHAWSTTGRHWTYSPRAAFGATVNYTDGTSETFVRRERPHVLVENGVLTHLISGVQRQERGCPRLGAGGSGMGCDRTSTLVQPIRS